MLIELSPLEVSLIVRRFDETVQKDLEEQLLVNKLRPFLVTATPRTYLQEFKTEPPLPPMPQE